MADNTEFCSHVVQSWRVALDAIRRAGGRHITVPVADMAAILHAADNTPDAPDAPKET